MPLQTLGRFLELSKQEQGIVLSAAAGLVATWGGLRVFGFRGWEKVLKWCTPRAVREIKSEQSIDRARDIARLQAAAERHLLFRMSCLEHSLVLRWMLRRHGIDANLRFGGRKEETRFEAHAWVEVCGASFGEVNGGEGIHFVPFESSESPMETGPH